LVDALLAFLQVALLGRKGLDFCRKILVFLKRNGNIEA
jgi:hypothetical protein